ncbi:MAG: SH3 domain-containing protein [bacterium]|nr:SH3 domain-containing protein [bacterium]
MNFFRPAVLYSTLFLATCLAAACFRAKEADQSRRYYTSASALYVRSAPALNATPIMLIPYGTAVTATKTDREDRVGDAVDFWYFVQETQGYVFGLYLQESPPASGRKQFWLKRKSSDNCHYWTTAILELSSGSVRFFERVTGEGAYLRQSRMVGRYELYPGKLVLRDMRGTVRVGTEGEQDEYFRSESLVLEGEVLSYGSAYGGFLSERQLKKYGDGQSREHIFLSKVCAFKGRRHCDYADADRTWLDGIYCAERGSGD